MSLYYTHLLIPVSPEYRPEPDLVAAFAQGMIDNRNVSNPFSISFSGVAKREPFFREIRNTVTGETIKMPLPSRKTEPPQTLNSPRQVLECALGQREYDVAIVSEGMIPNPPCPMGFVENDRWQPVTDACYIEIRCRVRNNPVRLSMLRSEAELHAPPDISTWQPIFDEDCSADDHDGIFVHPGGDAIRIPNAGCGTFWIEFNYGKFIFPLLEDGGVNILADSVVTLARKTFGGDFVQACNWG